MCRTYGLVQLLDQSHLLSLNTTMSEAAASTGMNQIDELGIGQLEKVLEVNTTVAELTESTLLLALLHQCESPIMLIQLQLTQSSGRMKDKNERPWMPCWAEMIRLGIKEKEKEKVGSLRL